MVRRSRYLSHPDPRYSAFPALILVSWALLGIEGAAVECERPFRWDANHLALGRMGVVVSQNIGQTLRCLSFQSLTHYGSSREGTDMSVAQSSSSSNSPAPVGPQASLDSICIVANGGEEASSNGGPTLISRALRPSYSRLTAPSAVRPSSRPRSRRPSHDLAFGRVRVEATVSSSSVPSQRSNPLPMEK